MYLFMYVLTDKENFPQSTDVHRTKTQAMHHIATIWQQPTEKHKKLRTEFGLHERDNPLFELSVDLYRCLEGTLNTEKKITCMISIFAEAPVECLHTISFKYLLSDLMDQLSLAQKQHLQQGLANSAHPDLHQSLTQYLQALQVISWL